jgi:hypothetical protein
MYNNIVIYIVGPPPEESPTSSEMHIFQVNNRKYSWYVWENIMLIVAPKLTGFRRDFYIQEIFTSNITCLIVSTLYGS